MHAEGCGRKRVSDYALSNSRSLKRMLLVDLLIRLYPLFRAVTPTPRYEADEADR